MPANSQPANAKTKPRVTLFPGSVIFCRQEKYSHSHLYRVLLGQRESASIVRKYAAWLESNHLPWPTAAKVSPQVQEVAA
jgi:hypothetical protein